jgi:ribosomal protein S18 acetylase RimI-like enzyme
MPALRRSATESARFGMTVDRLELPLDIAAPAAEVRATVAGSTADVVVLRYPERRVELAAEMLRAGREVVFADTLVYWSLRTGSGRPPTADPLLRTATDPLPDTTVDELVADIFDDYANHYRSNPLFRAEDALAGYQEWARKAIAAAPPVTVWNGEAALGVATLGVAEDHLEIELAGIRAAAQGRGVYAHLLAATERLAEQRRLPEVWISTQGHNTNVQRAWARYGFEPRASFVTLHLVRDGLLGS